MHLDVKNNIYIDIYGVEIYDFVRFGVDPDNNPDRVEENAESTLHKELYLLRFVKN